MVAVESTPLKMTWFCDVVENWIVALHNLELGMLDLLEQNSVRNSLKFAVREKSAEIFSGIPYCTVLAG